ncbi:Phosphoribosylamine-glycine ligase [Propionispora sp. 2/2-37]|uniref:phosphoribosylamine--glycine ligase n=1 Tax=Propionispora sp. 2/2-37 TaxID=1677858 RepID=UPI0006BB6DF0|nr:phosphoribosylamine--glycine ligase [Propionispora sp. 2/2-37]CUH96322.1 Phosphoribosylamine-glycine ligase [Propionispora sp. 2/2-37]
MRILVIGSGGREHALVWKLKMSPRVEKIYAIPGNPGISQLAECISMNMEDNRALADFAQKHGVNLTVVGPEAPLANGIVDYFHKQGLTVFGPTQAAAELEGSKSFAKGLMQKYNIPTARFAVFNNPDEAAFYIQKQGAPIVVKADGLAAGKGVIVAMTVEEALQAVDTIMREQAFGTAGSQIVIEEFLSGEEASLLAFTDGKTVVPMVAAQDHKRIFDGDQGPNTGGMGAYAPAPVVTAVMKEKIVHEILQPAVDAMRAEGRLYRGCLYAGLMITAEGPKVIEFNARFGDPETQVVLPLLESDLVDIMEACTSGTLSENMVSWRQEAAVCVVMAAGGYPGNYAKHDPISGLEAAKQQGAYVFHAGTAAVKDAVVTNGGRVLGVTATAGTIAAAVTKTYEAVRCIGFNGMQFRTDIAHRAMNR